MDAASTPALLLHRVIPGAEATDGLLCRAGRRAGPLAECYQALASYHGTEAELRALHLMEQCVRGDIDAAFEEIHARQPRAPA